MLGGTVDDVLYKVSIAEEISGQLNWTLIEWEKVHLLRTRNYGKVSSLAPGFHVTFYKRVTLLGSPFSNNVDESILDKVRLFEY